MKEKIIAKFLPLSLLTLCLILGFQQVQAQGIRIAEEEMTELGQADYSAQGIFYADQGVAVLDGYTVSNAFSPSEKFDYEFVIKAGDDFVIPSGKEAALRSCNKIVLTPGFFAAPGASVQVGIDMDCSLTAASLVGREDAPSRPANAAVAFTNAHSFPNPFTSVTTIEFSVEAEAVLSVEVTSLTGQRIALLRENERFSSGDYQILFDASDLPTGIYLCNLRDKNGFTNHLKLVKQ